MLLTNLNPKKLTLFYRLFNKIISNSIKNLNGYLTKLLTALVLIPCVLNASIEEKISQLFILPVTPQLGMLHLYTVTTWIERRSCGGILLMQGNLPSQHAAISMLQNVSTQPLLCFQDAEWGLAQRLQGIRPLPKAILLGKIEEEEELLEMGREIGRDCRLGGIHWNLAPVADVNCNPDNPVIQSRSFGSDPHQVARAAVFIMQGMKEMGILTCAKHFPGHGDTTIDSHFDLPIIPHSLERLREVELIPFERLIQAGVDAVMVGHLALPALDPSGRPASLSPAITTKLLKEEMGFKGIVISDALNMQALEKHYAPEEIAVMAFEAGCDLLLYAAIPEQIELLYEETLPRAMEGLKAAVLNGRITEEAIDAKLSKIQQIKNHLATKR